MRDILLAVCALILSACSATEQVADSEQENVKGDGSFIVEFQYLEGYGETFSADGSWQVIKPMRGPLQASGTWSLQSGQICVTLEPTQSVPNLVGAVCRDAPIEREGSYYFSEIFDPEGTPRRVRASDISSE